MSARIFSKVLLPFLILTVFALPNFVSALVNINTAASSELQTLQGIGPAIAQRIIDYRVENGPFQTIEGIMNVSGIGTVTFGNIRDFITVGSVASTPDAESTTTTASSASPVPGQPSPSAAQTLSSSSLSAGRDRVVAVGTPVDFRLESGPTSGIFRWNFGDGTQGGGANATHVYEYPGDYVVVLSTNISGSEASARVNVRVIEPEVLVSVASAERIEITNPLAQEVDLFGRAISVGGKVFMFPKDTFIGSGARVSFSSRITGLAPSHAGEVEWVVIGENRDVHRIAQMVEARREERIANIRSEIDVLQDRLAVARNNTSPAPLATVAVDAENETEELEEPETLLASVVSIADSLERTGWWEKMKKFFLRR